MTIEEINKKLGNKIVVFKSGYLYDMYIYLPDGCFIYKNLSLKTITDFTEKHINYHKDDYSDLVDVNSIEKEISRGFREKDKLRKAQKVY